MNLKLKKTDEGSGGGVVGFNLKSKAGWQVTGPAWRAAAYKWARPARLPRPVSVAV